jgi:dienelactone hydrolase
MAIRHRALAIFFAAALLARPALPQSPAKTPAFAILDPADAAQWQTWAKGRGWQVIAPPAASANAAMDARVEALASAVQEAVRSSGVDPARIYLAGRGASAAAVFYAVSRLPDVFAAAFALGGALQQAIDTGIVFAANFSNTPVLWAGAGPDDATLAAKWKAAGLNLDFRPAGGLGIAAVTEWLAGHTREDFPTQIDCETTSGAFGRCYWAQMIEFDPGERNDVLPATALKAGSGASLDLGAFVYKTDEPGPGVLVSSLPPKYDGPLKAGDRILELDGKPIENARAFDQTMRDTTEPRNAVVLVARGAERKRMETRILLPSRPTRVTARVQAQYVASEDEIRIVSRTVTELRVTVPAHWIPVTVNWNGLPLEQLHAAGCVDLTVRNELLHAEPCP